MKKPIDELYFTWLYSLVGDPGIKDPTRTYWRLLQQLYTVEFVWIIPNDDNRVEDGKELRYEFVDQSGLNDVDLRWIQPECSMLELLIGLSRRLSFEAEGEPRDWFWRLIDNLGLLKYNDARSYSPANVELVLEKVIWRTYQPNGRGGLFPLVNPQDDQRRVELWYQLSAYVLEHA